MEPGITGSSGGVSGTYFDIAMIGIADIAVGLPPGMPTHVVKLRPRTVSNNTFCPTVASWTIGD